MPFLRIILYQPHAHYRIPFSSNRRLTYPIPPYSTVIGFLCNVCGINDQRSDEYRYIRELKISICGRFASKTTEYIWLRNLKKESHIKYYGAELNREKNGWIGHPGGQMPAYIDILNHVELVIYLYHEAENVLKFLKDNLENPHKRLGIIHLGRAEDWVVFKDIKILENNKIVYKDIIDGNYNYFFWIPEKIYIPLNNETQSYEEYDGVIYLINTFSKVEGYEETLNISKIRIYERTRVKLNEGKIVRNKGLKDEELNLPVFLWGVETCVKSGQRATA